MINRISMQRMKLVTQASPQSKARMSTHLKVNSILAAAVLAAFSFTALPSQAGVFDDDEARKAILELRGKMDMLRRDLRSEMDNKADKSGTLDLASQNEQLRGEIAKLRGQVEVLSYELNNAQQRQKDFYIDLDTRLRRVEPQKVSVDGQETSVEAVEQKTYETALGLFKSGDYKNASIAFSAFLRRYPQSGYAPTAQYLLGNAYYAQRDFRNAIMAQQGVLNNYPESVKVADAMLNIASSYTELKEKPAAKKTLEALIAKYPDSAAAQTAKGRLVELK
jgi:tol-pal system protein YbgF